MCKRDKGRHYHAARGSIFGLITSAVVLVGCDGGALSSSSNISSSESPQQHSSQAQSSVMSSQNAPTSAGTNSSATVTLPHAALLPSIPARSDGVTTFTSRLRDDSLKVLAVQFIDMDDDGDLDILHDEITDTVRRLVWYDNNRPNLIGYQSLDDLPRHDLATLESSEHKLPGILQLADINNDGTQDIVWGKNSRNILQVFNQQPVSTTSRWKNSHTLTTPQGWQKILRGDISDQQSALLVSTPNGISLAHISDDWTLQEDALVIAEGIQDFWLLDLEHNGLNDIVYHNDYGVFWAQNQGGNTFSTPEKLLEKVDYKIGIADFDNDGFDELWSVNTSTLNSRNSMTLLRYEYVATDSQLKSHEKIALPFDGYTSGLAVGDIDADGDADVIFSYWRPAGEVSHWLENTHPDLPLFDRGTIIQHDNSSFFNPPLGLQDFNGNGIIDIITSNYQNYMPLPIPRQTLYIEADKKYAFDLSLIMGAQDASAFTLSATLDSTLNYFHLNGTNTELIIAPLPTPINAQDANLDSRYELWIQYQKDGATHSVLLSINAYSDDGDIDDDGVADIQDQAPFNPEIIFDNDGDGIGDSHDTDDDNDGHDDSVDNAPFNGLYYLQPEWKSLLDLGSQQQLKRTFSTTPLFGIRKDYDTSLIPLFSNLGRNIEVHADTAIYNFDYHPADFNNDGLIDLFATRADGTAAVFINAGDGEFTQHGFGNFSGRLEAAVADVDGDGAIDIILGEYFSDDYSSSSQVYIYLNKLNQGLGFVQRKSNLNSPSPSQPKQDIDGNGTLDSVLGNGIKNQNFQWLQGVVSDDRIDFTPRPSTVNDEQYLASAYQQYRVVAAGHFNQDTITDLLAVETPSYSPEGAQYRLLLGEAAETNTAVEPLEYRAQILGRFPKGKVAAADINNDGVLDIVIGAGQAFTLLLSDGGPQNSYRKQEWFTGIGGVTTLTADDIDGDGDADIIIESKVDRDAPIVTHWFENTTLSAVSFKYHSVHASPADAGSGIFVDILGYGMKSFLFNAQPSGLPVWKTLNTQRHTVAEGDQLMINSLAIDGDNNALNYQLGGISQDLINAVSIDKETGVITLQAPNNGDQSLYFWLTVDDGFSQLRRYFNIVVYRDDGDADNDGIPDSDDALPFDPSETVDTDGDGIGNHQDIDDDGDLVPDVDDAQPLYASVSEALQWLAPDEIATTDNSIYSNDARRLQDNLWLVDFNADGAVDVIAEEYNGELLYFENKNQSHIAFSAQQAPTDLPMGFGSLRQYIDYLASHPPEGPIHDFNNDGIADGLYFSGRKVQVELSQGNNKLWHEITNYFSYNDVTTVQAADIDADGNEDIVVANAVGDVAWFKNEGGAVPIFTRHDIELEYSGSDYAAIADVDGDGDLDIVHAPNKWFENDGSAQPNFTKHSVGKSFYSSRYVTVADLNNDGELEFVGVISDSGPHVNWYTTVSRSVTVVEGINNHTVIVSELAISGDGVPILYSITMGPDASLFEVNPQGDITFTTTPDNDKPGDQNHDNIYDFWLTASNGIATLHRRIQVTVSSP